MIYVSVTSLKGWHVIERPTDTTTLCGRVFNRRKVYMTRPHGEFVYWSELCESCKTIVDEFNAHGALRGDV